MTCFIFSLKDLAFSEDNFSHLGYQSQSKIFQFNLKTKSIKKLTSGPFTSFTPYKHNGILMAKLNQEKQSSTLIQFSGSKQTRLLDIPYYVIEMVYHQETLYLIAKKHAGSFGIYTLNLETSKITPLIQTPYIEHDLYVTDLHISTSRRITINSHNATVITKKQNKLNNLKHRHTHNLDS